MSNAARMREWRQERTAKGLCMSCGDNLPDTKFRKCPKCRDYHKNYARQYAKTPKAKAKHQQRVNQWQRDNPERVAAHGKFYRTKVRSSVLDHYGRLCACCGETREEFLTIDHIENGGNRHRRQLFGAPVGGARFYAWLRREGFPLGFQILCWNCNHAKALYGKCPHGS